MCGWSVGNRSDGSFGSRCKALCVLCAKALASRLYNREWLSKVDVRQRPHWPTIVFAHGAVKCPQEFIHEAPIAK